jgi:HNH endonuclease
VTTSGPTPGREHESAGHAFGITNGGSGQRRAEHRRAIQAPPAKLANLTNPVARAVDLVLSSSALLIARSWDDATQSWEPAGCSPGPADPYGRIGKGSERFVHRLGWKQLRGPIPNGMELHHRCGVHACWNPDHLQLVTHAENLAYRRKTHCKRGHPLSGANLRIDPRTGARSCPSVQRRPPAFRERQAPPKRPRR